MLGARVNYSQSKYAAISGSFTDDTAGVVIPNGDLMGVFHFRGNGSDPTAYVALVWDWGGAAQKIIAATRGDIDVTFDISTTDYQFTGDGVKKLNVILINDSTLTSQIIGGAWEATKLN